MTLRYVLALDQGTTSSRAILFDEMANIIAMAQEDLPQIFPQPGWVEHDPRMIWETQLRTARQVIHQVGNVLKDIAAIGITNQRETTIVWDRKTGEPIANAIVWQDRRTAPWCDKLKRDGAESLIQAKTGLVIDAYFSASKIAWLLDHVPGARERAERGELAFGTVDTWLLWNLTGGRIHATDVTNASRTMAFNIHTLAWDDELLDLMHLPRSLFPDSRPTSGHFGDSDAAILGRAIPIGALAGDQHAALFGQTCFTRGTAKNTYGTGCFMLMNVGEKAPVSANKLLSTVAWQIPGSTQYALEGSVFIGGAVVQWLRDGLGIIQSANDVEALASSVPDNGGVYLVPAFAGLGAPHWDMYARGSISGLTRGATSAHIARAAIESIAFQVADVLDVITQDSGIALSELRVDGGAASNNLLLQFQADLLQRNVVRPIITQSTALGAAYLAGLLAGVWKSRDQLSQLGRVDRIFEPRMKPTDAARRRERWADALKRCLDWEK